MSEKYCPLGKCECEYYPNCMASDFEEFDIEVCPWPSQQKLVELKDKTCPICNGTGKTTLEQHNYLREQYILWFNSGKTEQARVDNFESRHYMR